MAGEPSAQDVADASESEWHPRVLAHLRQIESALFAQIFRKPEDDEKNHGVGEETRQDEGPAAARREQSSPVHALRGSRTSFLRWRQQRLEFRIFVRAQPAIEVRRLIENQPQPEPADPNQSGKYERVAPSIVQRDDGDSIGRECRTERRSGIENPHGERTLPRWKPLRDGFRGGRPGTRLTQSQQKPECPQAPFADGESVQELRNGPPGDEHSESSASAQAV